MYWIGLQPGDIVLVKSSNGVGLRWLGDRLAAAGDTHATDASPAGDPHADRSGSEKEQSR